MFCRVSRKKLTRASSSACPVPGEHLQRNRVPRRESPDPRSPAARSSAATDLHRPAAPAPGRPRPPPADGAPVAARRSRRCAAPATGRQRPCRNIWRAGSESERHRGGRDEADREPEDAPVDRDLRHPRYIRGASAPRSHRARRRSARRRRDPPNAAITTLSVSSCRNRRPRPAAHRGPDRELLRPRVAARQHSGSPRSRRRISRTSATPPHSSSSAGRPHGFDLLRMERDDARAHVPCWSAGSRRRAWRISRPSPPAPSRE